MYSSFLSRWVLQIANSELDLHFVACLLSIVSQDKRCLPLSLPVEFLPPSQGRLAVWLWPTSLGGIAS